MSAYDAIVIGGGFAGVTAARELGFAGQRVLLLEARDRLGGRTWYSQSGDLSIELGGTWVHWIQPHVWTEITRYGLALKESPKGERGVWLFDGERRAVTVEELGAILVPALERFFHDSQAVFELPMDPLAAPEALAAVDALSAQDRIDALDFSAEERALLRGQLSTICSAPAEEGGLAVALHWYALAGWDFRRLMDAGGRYKLADGTKRLLDAMFADARADLRCSAPVASVVHDERGVAVTTRAGEQFTAATAVVTVPLNTLAGIDFAPELAPGKRAAAAEGQASRGLKVFVRVRGEMEDVFARGDDEQVLTSIHTEFHLPGETVFIGYGSDATRLDVTDLDAVREAVHAYLPELDVVGCVGHDWVADEFSRSTWPILRPLQMSQRLRELQRPEGRVCFAGSDIADGWNGFIDGAIESGLRAGREAIELVRASRARLTCSFRDARPHAGEPRGSAVAGD